MFQMHVSEWGWLVVAAALAVNHLIYTRLIPAMRRPKHSVEGAVFSFATIEARAADGPIAFENCVFAGEEDHKGLRLDSHCADEGKR